MKNMKEKRGITLIALAVTIIVILILAGVTIDAVFSENGIINKAKEAANSMNNAVANDQAELNDLLEELNEIMNLEWNSNIIIPDPGEDEESIKDIIDTGKIFEETSEIEDDYGNIVKIPEGFKLAEDSGVNVEEGIVIEDATSTADNRKGSQFVWIPCGNYNTSKGEKTNNLSRRTFTTTASVEVNGDSVIENEYLGEGSVGSILYSESDSKYKIDYFKESVGNAGGFYVARYEAGGTSGLITSKKGQTVFTGKRDLAYQQAKLMYNGNNIVISALINSYAYDTVCNFICQNSEYGYTLATTTNNIYGNIDNSGNYLTTGSYKVNEKESDCYGKIYDMLGNYWEWTTEHTNNSKFNWVLRGGCASSNSGGLVNRGYRNNASGSHGATTFRTILYFQ